jgi:hypothetical protein
MRKLDSVAHVLNRNYTGQNRLLYEYCRIFTIDCSRAGKSHHPHNLRRRVVELPGAGWTVGPSKKSRICPDNVPQDVHCFARRTILLAGLTFQILTE